jgi:hypothetical protein
MAGEAIAKEREFFAKPKETKPKERGFFANLLGTGLALDIQDEKRAARQIQNQTARLKNAHETIKSMALIEPDNELANTQLNQIFAADNNIPEFTGGGKDFSVLLDKARAGSRTAPTVEEAQAIKLGAGEKLVTDTQAGQFTREVPVEELPSKSEIQAREINKLIEIPREKRTRQQQANLEKGLFGGPAVNVNVGEGKAPPQFLMGKLMEAATVQRDIDLTLDLLNPGKGGLESVGLMDLAVSKFKGGTGTLSPEEQIFIQTYTRLQKMLRILNGEARMSDADLERLRPALPSRILQDKTFKAAVESLSRDNTDILKGLAEDTTAWGYIVPPSVLKFTEKTKPGSQSKRLEDLTPEDLASMSSEELEALLQ